MSKFSIVVILLCSCFPYSSAMQNVVSNSEIDEDRRALLDFKSKISSDPLEVLGSWNGTTPLCHCPGVTCSRRHGRVTELDLGSSKLTGSLAPSLGNMSFLRELYLENNSFVGEIPPEVGRLQRLVILSLSNNSLSGWIPSNLSGCTNLRYLNIGYNQIGGRIPEEFGLLSKLEYAYMMRNNFNGAVPSSYGNLSSLRMTLLSENMLNRIPDTVGKLRKLITFSFGGNIISGTIPDSLFNLTAVTFFNVNHNLLHGSLPANLFDTLPNIEYFGVAQNRISGTIPTSIANATTLRRLQWTYNNITGKIPLLAKLGKLYWFDVSYNLHGRGSSSDLDFLCSMTNASSLEQLGLDGNNFGGVLPECIGNLSWTLTDFALHGNSISGSIPRGIGNLVGLEVLDLGNNRLWGEIPHELGKLKKLELTYLLGNQFSGNIPSSLGNLKALTELNLHSNNLEGAITLGLSECSSLISLDLARNNLSGAIPSEIFKLSSLSLFLYLSHNSLTGPLPPEVGNLKNLGILDVSRNMLSGMIPATLGNCQSLETLHMQGNLFEGPIPSSFSSLRGMVQLDLSRNNLSGQIPEFFESFVVLQTLNLSYNDFEGPVGMNGVFSNASAFFIAGNSKLCGGIGELHLPACNGTVLNKEKLPAVVKFIVTAALSFAGLSPFLCALFSYWRRSQKGKVKVSPNSPLNPLPKLSYHDLLKATDEFSPDNVLGIGSFGSVYKGTLDTAGTVVAMKVLNLHNRRASRSFVAECEILKSIRHRNLVKLLTVCSGVDFKGDDFKALVYEFMPNMSLEEWLHPVVSKTDVKGGEQEACRNLSLIERLNIAIDVASAVDYLHHHCQTPVVHCDIKPSNVLLDHDMTGHLSDFGLAMFLFETSDGITTDTPSLTSVLGTVGYSAPEYGSATKASRSGDVFSYGILLLEIFSGKKPTHDNFEGSLTLHSFVDTALTERVGDITDPKLLQYAADKTRRDYCWPSDPRSEIIQECLIRIFKIGIACSVELPSERKNIREVVAELQSIRDQLWGHLQQGEPDLTFTFRV